MSQTLKLVIVGDGAVGKTCMLVVHSNGTFPTDYVPTVCENYRCKVIRDDIEYSIQLWDTAGQEEMESVRKLSYSHTDVFLICFSVADRSSFANVEDKWISELRASLDGAKLMLVGTKTDLRNEAGPQRVTVAEGAELAARIGAFDYKECSAQDGVGVKEVFERAANYVIKGGSRGCCNVQ
jgi:small GTP-binding protein